MSDVENRLFGLEQRRQRLDARLTGMRARASIAEVKRLNRRRLLAGDALLSLLEGQDPAWTLVARVLLDRMVKRADERALFSLDS